MAKQNVKQTDDADVVREEEGGGEVVVQCFIAYAVTKKQRRQ